MGGFLCACACVCVYLHFIYSVLYRVTRRGHTWEGGTLCCSTLSARPDGSCHWKRRRSDGRKRERGSSELLLTVPEWPVPRATTSGDHLQLAHPTSSILFPFPLAFSLCFSKWGRWQQWQWSVWSGCGLCPYFRNFGAFLLLIEENGGEGVSERIGWGGEGGGSGAKA